jgi:alkylation response protein AidB-like acyl-CoA dehydrogenase
MAVEQDETRTQLLQSVAAFVKARRGFGDSRPQPPGDDAGVSLWREMADLGWNGILLPEAVGGSELPLSYAACIVELLSQSCMVTPLIGASWTPSLLLAPFASDPRVQALAAGLADGSRRASVAWQETANQIEVEPLAVRLENGRLEGRKVFLRGAEGASHLIVSAAARGRPAVVVVPFDAKGVSLDWAPMSDRTQTAVATFDTAVTPDGIIAEGEEARRALDRAILGGTILQSAALAGLARGVLDITIRYLHDRTQFGERLSEFQALRHRVVDLYAQTRLAAASWRAAAAGFEENALADATRAAVSAAKARCGDTGVTVAKAAVQMHGAIGFTEDADIGRYLNAALTWSSTLGKSATHLERFFAIQSDENAA